MRLQSRAVDLDHRIAAIERVSARLHILDLGLDLPLLQLVQFVQAALLVLDPAFELYLVPCAIRASPQPEPFVQRVVRLGDAVVDACERRFDTLGVGLKLRDVKLYLGLDQRDLFVAGEF